MTKQFKILGDSFKQYKASSANTFIDDGIVNKISKDNIQEIIKNFVDNKLKVFVYSKHKSDMSEERPAIGEVLNLSACKDEVGLLADIYFNDDGEKLLEKNSFYPSIEMSGLLEDFKDNINTWSHCMLKGLAFVEYPASSNVDLLCLSGIIEYNQKELENMDDKVKELMQQLESGNKDVLPELLELVKQDDTLLGELIMKALTPPATAPSTTETTETKTDDGTTTTETTTVEENADGTTTTTEEEKKKEEANLSMLTWQNACKAYAQKQGAYDIALSGVENTYSKAKKMFKSGLTIDEIVDYFKSSFSLLGGIKKEKATVDLSAVKDDDRYADIGASFRR